MTVCMCRDIHTLQPYIIDFTQRGCHTLRLSMIFTGIPRSSKLFLCYSSFDRHFVCFC